MKGQRAFFLMSTIGVSPLSRLRPNRTALLLAWLESPAHLYAARQVRAEESGLVSPV
jgi:hypothetical protein